MGLESMKNRHADALLAVDPEAFKDNKSVDDYIDYHVMRDWFTASKGAFNCMSCGMIYRFLPQEKCSCGGTKFTPARWDDWHIRSTVKHAEPLEHFLPVILGALNDLLDTFKGKKVIVFSHGQAIKAVKQHFGIRTKKHGPANTEAYYLRLHHRDDGVLSLKEDRDSILPLGHGPLVRGFVPSTVDACQTSFHPFYEQLLCVHHLCRLPHPWTLLERQKYVRDSRMGPSDVRDEERMYR